MTAICTRRMPATTMSAHSRFRPRIQRNVRRSIIARVTMRRMFMARAVAIPRCRTATMSITSSMDTCIIRTQAIVTTTDA